MKRLSLFMLVVSVLLMSSCKNDNGIETPTPSGYVLGKNRFTMQVDGDTREYYVHVPAKYNANTPTPVVFMLHGTSGDGERFYIISGWKEVGEAENILTVYPSSWRCAIAEQNLEKNSKFFCAQRIDEPNCKSLIRWVHLSVGEIVFFMAARRASVFNLFENLA
jgi:polyhydroxybutyrate depolymerase